MYTLTTVTKDAWGSMLADLQKAQRSIYAEFFIMSDDRVGNQFFNLFIEKAKQGVSVAVLLDAIGSFEIKKETIERLRNAGVTIEFFHMFRGGYKNPWKRLVSRMHRKILVVDEAVAYVGGVNIEKKMGEWYDFALRIEDPTQAHMLAASVVQSIQFNKKRQKRKEYIVQKKKLSASYTFCNHITYYFCKGKRKNQSNRQLYLKLITNAKTSVQICTPYFYPDREFLKTLQLAAARGVQIEVLFPKYTDVFLATYATHAYISILLQTGIRVYVHPHMLHAKAMIVDQTKVLFGSSNLDITSLYDNFELDVASTHEYIVSHIQQAFDSWRDAAEAVSPSSWDNRATVHKIKEMFAIYLYRLWHWRVRYKFRLQYVKQMIKGRNR